MRKYIILLLMFVMVMCSGAQDKRFTVFGYSDPVATYHDGFNLGAGIEYQMTISYFKAQIFVFPNLRGKKYLELTGTPLGFNQHFGMDHWRTYEGLKMGVIQRDVVHPTIGLEFGLEYYFKNIYVGGGWSYDYRTDGKEQETDIKDYWRLSGLLKIGIAF